METTKTAENREKFGRTKAPEDAIGCYNEPFEDDEESFIFRNDDREILERFALWANSPWSSKHEQYVIEYNSANAYSKPKEDWPEWRCSYLVIGYEYATATVYGFGDTEEEALIDCKKNFELIQKEYNPEGDSI